VIILDTNVLSELLKASPSPAVKSWVAGHASASLFTTTITEAEMLLGVALLGRGKRRQMLEESMAGMFETDFAGRLLPFDSSAARSFARLVARRRAMGRPIAQLDAQIAGITHSRGAKLATRNLSDFEGCEIELVNPWS
jgi:predicted nucleic acid-binding protein